MLRGCGAARPLGSGLCRPGFQFFSLAAIAFLSVLALIFCSCSLDTGSLDLESDFDGENLFDTFLGWCQSVKMRKDICANCSLSIHSRQVRGGRFGTQAAAPCSAAAIVDLMVFMLVSAGAFVAAAAAVNVVYVLEIGVNLFGLEEATVLLASAHVLLEVLCCAWLDAAPIGAALLVVVFTIGCSFVLLVLLYLIFAGLQPAFEESQQQAAAAGGHYASDT